MKTNTDVDRDDTIAEIHRTRERIAERFHGDLFAIVEDARHRQKESGVLVVDLAQEKEPLKADR